ncbi:1-acyl-sn-glycerol-3-phosphate acyltransferase [Dinghuibacter silviterrae]|uniref:1-acyl-sn-glycerol-3-phosphate acyltransferase n=1 Tax=Dinghuibacter silviterrae TaxID=1539049 RepID=A0A4R8DEU6_9BACT|nr:1-acyl-sn-glycerol-3-phosphate acyltransferase [Dinghuibacter silviterrae]
MHWLYVLYALILFGLTLILTFLLAVPASFLGETRGGNLIYKICRAWADVWLAGVGIRHKNIYVHRPQKGSPCIYVANHISFLDAALIVKAVRYPVRPLGKIEMTKAPLFGFIYKKAIVVVDRSDPEHRAASVRRLVKQLQKGISVFIFPEGTFNLTGKPLAPFYDGAFRMAIETGYPVQPVLFLDAGKRLPNTSIFKLNPGRSRAVFLESVPVDGLTLDDVHRLKTLVHEKMEKGLNDYGPLSFG